MGKSWLFGTAMVGCVSSLLLGLPVNGHAESKDKLGEATRGKTLFIRNCSGCHGAEGEGDGYRLLGPDPANLTAPSTKKKSDAELLKTIHNGKPNMPAWKGNLSENQSRDVLAYVRTLGK
jgi:mono/diheme cytochrome c family protein